MRTQGPAPDLKCELNITSFLALQHPLHCSICAKDIMVTVLILQVNGGWEGWGVVHLCQGFEWGDRGWVSVFLFLFCFCAVANCSFRAGT